ncbi:MAG: hypothetical protein H0U12_06260 [Thermoleophilaceae bacterium]|nr:hypothetical protein [Thermoleophilaceae bacterium]
MAEGTLKDWLAEHPPPDHAFTQSLAVVAERAREGADFPVAIREFLDEFALLPRSDLRARALSDQPSPTGAPRYDAYLGALAEHLAAIHGLERPAWTVDPVRFLEAFWFPSEVRGFRALAIAQSPAAFRRRGIFIAQGSLDRR